MPRKKPPTITLPVVLAPATDLVRPMTVTGDLVRVDAIYHVPAVHPSGDGPWTNEADKVAWTDPLTGYGCIIRRSPNGRFLAGYVSVPPSHPLYGRDVHTLTGLGIAIHGGLDYSAACEHQEREEYSVCHVVKRIVPEGFQQRIYANDAAQEQHDDAWWLGFSCDKPGDIIPVPYSNRTRHVPRPGIEAPTYKTEGFVHDECVRLALQLKAIEEGRDPREADPGPTPMQRPVRELGK